MPVARGLFYRIVDRLLRPAPEPPKKLRASYDIAQTNADNARQWKGADWLDADASDSPGVRQIAATAADMKPKTTRR